MVNQLSKWMATISSRLWSGVIMAFLLGQVLAIQELGFADITLFCLGLCFVISFTLSSIFFNHLADQKSDLLKQEMNENCIRYSLFPSPKLLKTSGIFFGSISFSFLSIIGIISENYWILIFGFLGYFLLALYSFKPFRFNYKGGGEFLELLGISILIPIFSYFLNTQSLHFPKLFTYALPFTLLILGNTIAHSLLHAKSDKYAGKTTFVTVSGFKGSRLLIEYSLFTFLLVIIGLKWLGAVHELSWIFVVCSAISILYFFMAMKKLPGIVSINQDSLNLFEFYTNTAILFGMGIINFGLFYEYLIRP